MSCRLCTFLITTLVAGLSVWTTVAGAQDDKKTAPSPAIVLKRRDNRSDEDLRKELLLVKEAGFDQGSVVFLYGPIKAGGANVTKLPPDLGRNFFANMLTQTKKPDQPLPWRAEADCVMGRDAAETLNDLSIRLRAILRATVPVAGGAGAGGTLVRPDPEKVRSLLIDGQIVLGGVRVKPLGIEAKPSDWLKPEAIPTLMQILQAENTATREVLVDVLGHIKGKDASLALVQRAQFELSPELREKAVKELAKRPVREYQTALRDGLRYPWAPAADHAAEAIVALRLHDLLPDLVQLLKEPDPSLPAKNDKGQHMVTELVRINHLANCMLCHAPSLSKDDLIRGRVSIPGEDPPPLYYAAATGIFVRADITYLKQDFSVVQPVSNSGKWPGDQRYDYVLHTRHPTNIELNKVLQMEKDNKFPKTYRQRDAALFALRQITKADAGEHYDDWVRDLPKLRKVLLEEKK